MDETHLDVVPVDDLQPTEPGLPPSALVALESSLRSGGSGRGPRSIARRLGVLTSGLVLAVVAAAGFVAGVQVQKHNGGTTVATSSTGAAGRAAAFGAASTGATGATGSSGAAGTGAGAGAAGAGRRGAGGAAGATGTPGAAGASGAAGATGGATAGGGGTGRGAFGGGGGGAATAGQVKLIDGSNIYVTDATGNVVKVTTSDASRFTHTGPGSINDILPGDTVVVQGQKGADGIVSATAVADTGATTGG